VVAVPVRPETTVVCDVIVEITEVTVPIGSSGPPAIAALLDTPPNPRMTRTRTRIAADRIPISVYPFLEEKTRVARRVGHRRQTRVLFHARR
jgi:hypothetical protein